MRAGVRLPFHKTPWGRIFVLTSRLM